MPLRVARALHWGAGKSGTVRGAGALLRERAHIGSARWKRPKKFYTLAAGCSRKDCSWLAQLPPSFTMALSLRGSAPALSRSGSWSIATGARSRHAVPRQQSQVWRRRIHCTALAAKVIPFNLPDIGEGIAEVILITLYRFHLDGVGLPVETASWLYGIYRRRNFNVGRGGRHATRL